MTLRPYLFILALLMAAPVQARAQLGSTAVVSTVTGIPCQSGYLAYQTDAPAGFQICTGGTWAAVATGGGALPSGLITFVLSGTCPTGTSEVSALNGNTLIGTLAANANVGTTGGSDSVTPTVASLTAAAQTFTGSSANTSAVSGGTPAGTNGTVNFTPVGTVAAPVFTGSALATHAHELPFQKTAGGTGILGMLAPSIFGTGTSRARESQSAAPTANATSAAVLLSQAVSAGTPAGTNTAPTFTGTQGSVPAQTFTGSALGTHQHTLTATGSNSTSAVTGTLNAIDVRSAFTRVIFCSAN